MRWLAMVVLCVAACGKGKQARFEGPMPVTFGACAGPTTTWVSGPRPLPFTLKEADGPWLAASKKPAPKRAPKDDPPPPPPEDDSGGTGTAMALDEGKMGKRGSADDQTARQQAIAQARAAGILGSTSRSSGDVPAADDSGFGPHPSDDSASPHGTIGHGWGTGAGYGGAGGNTATSPVPTVSVGKPNANGDLDKDIIRRYIRRNLQKITYCYEKQLLVKPRLKGTVTVQFFITPKGDVSSATASGMDPEVASCLGDVIKAIEFPKPRGGGGVQVNYPFTFRPAGDDSKLPPTPQPPSSPEFDDSNIYGGLLGSGSAGSAGSAAAAPVPAPAPAAGRERGLFRPVDAAYVDPSHYDPGSENPLVDEETPLTECFRRNTKHYGAVVVELHYDASGVVTSATASGLDNETATACVVAAAKLVKRSGGTAERCSIGFGDMPIAELPTIDLTRQAITFNNRPIAQTTTILADDTKVTKIADLVSAIAETVRAALAANVVSLHGPIGVRPQDNVPMKAVVRVLGSVIAAGDDFVLERKHGETWEPLDQMKFPVAPVPLGTGGTWNRVKGQSRLDNEVDDDEHVALSLLVEKDQIWVGISRVNDFIEIQNIQPDMHDWTKLETTLEEDKASAFFSDRTDIEIAAGDTVPYGDVLKAIDMARKVGFVEWVLTDPPGLAARPTL